MSNFLWVKMFFLITGIAFLQCSYCQQHDLFDEVSAICRKMVFGFLNQGYVFVSLKLCVKTISKLGCIWKLTSFFLSVIVFVRKTILFFPKIQQVSFYMPEFYCAEWLKENVFLAAELFGRLRNFYLLVVEWTKRSLSDIGKMNKPGQPVACLTPDDLQVLNILSISGLARFKPWRMTERRNFSFLHYHITWKKSTLSSHQLTKKNKLVKLQIPALLLFHTSKLPREVDVSNGYPITPGSRVINKTASVLIVSKCAWLSHCINLVCMSSSQSGERMNSFKCSHVWLTHVSN